MAGADPGQGARTPAGLRIRFRRDRAALVLGDSVALLRRASAASVREGRAASVRGGPAASVRGGRASSVRGGPAALVWRAGFALAWLGSLGLGWPPPAPAVAADSPAQTEAALAAPVASSVAAKALARAAEPFLRLSRFQAEFVQTQEWVGMDDPSFFKGMLYLERPNRFRLEYSEPQGHLQVCDGERVFTYVPENEQVLSTRLPPDGRADLLGRILEESTPDPEIEKTELDGIPVEVLSLAPPEGLDLERVRLWTRSDSGAILQYELIELSGNQSTFRFLKTWSDPEIDPELFHFVAPPGVPVVEVG